MSDVNEFPEQTQPMIIPQPVLEPETPEEPAAKPTPVKTYYRKRHSVSEAKQWTEDNESELTEFVGTVLGEGDVQVPRFREPDEEHENARIWSIFDETWHEVPPKAWIVKEKFADDFEYRIVTPEFFEKAYVEYA